MGSKSDLRPAARALHVFLFCSVAFNDTNSKVLQLGGGE